MAHPFFRTNWEATRESAQAGPALTNIINIVMAGNILTIAHTLSPRFRGKEKFGRLILVRAPASVKDGAALPTPGKRQPPRCRIRFPSRAAAAGSTQPAPLSALPRTQTPVP